MSDVQRVMLPCEHNKWNDCGQWIYGQRWQDSGQVEPCRGGRVVEIDLEATAIALARIHGINWNDANKRLRNVLRNQAHKVLAAALGIGDKP